MGSMSNFYSVKSYPTVGMLCGETTQGIPRLHLRGPQHRTDPSAWSG